MEEDLQQDLIDLGLQRYVSAFLSAGYDSWAIVADMMESDFDALDIRLGDRRKLQREIARRQFWPENSPLPSSDELREFTQSNQANGGEPFKDGYFQHHVFEAMDTEANSPQFPSSSAQEEPPPNKSSSGVAETSQSSDTMASLSLGPSINDEDETSQQNIPHHLSAVIESDDDPTPRAMEPRCEPPSSWLGENGIEYIVDRELASPRIKPS